MPVRLVRGYDRRVHLPARADYLTKPFDLDVLRCVRL